MAAGSGLAADTAPRLSSRAAWDRTLERSGTSDRDPTTVLRDTVEAIWKIIVEEES